MALEASSGSITKAVEFLKAPDNERFAFRARVLNVLASLREADDWDVLGYAAELVQLSKLPLDVVRESQEAELAENADFLAKSAIRQIEARNKRQLTAKSAESLRQLTAIIRSWLRDVLMVCSGTPELIINIDARDAIEDAATEVDEATMAKALRSVAACDKALGFNVSPETCLDVLLFDVREVVHATRSTR